MYEGFRRFEIQTSDPEVKIVGRVGGKGPAVLLIHGNPLTHAHWHLVAPRLARDFTVVATDLRGYGDSGKPATDAEHAPYSKRVMAADQVAVMRSLGYDRFLVVGHDRGARVGHRMAVDHPDAVAKLAVLDIAPTLAMYEKTTEAFARAYWHWFFLILPAPVPEKMIGADPIFLLRASMSRGRAGMKPFAPEAWAEYERCRTPEMIHASCEDYRAAASIDLVHDRADREAGRKVRCALLALWGEHGVIEACFEPMDEWRRVAEDVRGRALPAGHYLAEEIPEVVVEELEQFL